MGIKTTVRHSVAAAKLFDGCSKKERRRLDALSTPIEIKTGVELTTEGRIGHEFGVLLDGTATVKIDGESVATLRAGDHYGELALLDTIGEQGSRRTATVTADCDLWVAVMSVSEFVTVIKEFPAVAEAVRRSAVERTEANQGPASGDS